MANNTEKRVYLAPQLEVIEVEVEAGFAQSIEKPSSGGNHDWAMPFAGVPLGGE
ncbi:MAG: hypothetical protein IKU22_02225 [Alistipes sp.]|nr:hypothetical protein [Alistipes sp.]